MMINSLDANHVVDVQRPANGEAIDTLATW